MHANVVATDLISNIGKHYLHSETAVKRQIVSSVFPSGLVYGEKKVRTLELNKVMSRILSIDKAFGGPKKKKAHQFWCAFPSSGVGVIRI